MPDESKKERKLQEIMPSAEEVQKELAKAKSMDDFLAKKGFLPGCSPIRSRRCWKAN